VVDGVVGASMAQFAEATTSWWDADRAKHDVAEDPESSEAERRRAAETAESAGADLRSETIRLAAIPLAGAVAWPAAHLLLRPRRQLVYYHTGP
jgi:hypothetical protein